MGGAGSRNGINTDIVAANDTMVNTVDTKYTAHIGDDTDQENINSQTDAQVDTIAFDGNVNTGGGDIYINPVQANEQLPILTSTATQDVSITHGKFFSNCANMSVISMMFLMIFFFKLTFF